MFITIKPKIFISFILISIISLTLTFCLYKATTTNAEPQFNYTIIVDAGHGGRDSGASGINTGVKESDLSLNISKKLQISEKTVRNHISNVICKLGVSSRTQAILELLKYNILKLD